MEKYINKILRKNTNNYYIKEDKYNYQTFLNKTLKRFNMNYNYINSNEFIVPRIIGLSKLAPNEIYAGLLNKNKYWNTVYRSVERLCDKTRKYCIIPVSLSSLDYGNHLIIVIYVKSSDKFFVFDSSGAMEYCYDHIMENLLDFFGGLTILNKADLLQKDEREVKYSDEIDGYCVIWCCLYVTCLKKFGLRCEILPILLRIADTKEKKIKLIRNFAYMIENDEI